MSNKPKKTETKRRDMTKEEYKKWEELPWIAFGDRPEKSRSLHPNVTSVELLRGIARAHMRETAHKNKAAYRITGAHRRRPGKR